jgi:LPPG:FO 2-phospho-L-lactate transferase
MESISLLNGPVWFSLGDKDLGTHLERTRRSNEGQSLHKIVEDFCEIWCIEPTILPMSNESISTIVITEKGELPFQKYFVKEGFKPIIKEFQFKGVEAAVPAPGVISAIVESDLILICPSNPWVSIDPILSVPGIRETISDRRKYGAVTLAISPIVGGKAIKGPAAKMFVEMGFESSALSVAQHYGEILDGFIIDEIDSNLNSRIAGLGLNTFCAQTIMKSNKDRKKLAEFVVTCYRVLKNEMNTTEF